MNKYLVLILVLFTLRAYAQISPDQETRINELFKQWNTNSSPGEALGIIKDGKLIYTKGYGIADLEHNIPITDSSIFYIGSVSKQFVAMCILLLEEQGKLTLDDKVQKYLPDFPEYDAPLTIRNFINHTSGVRDNLTLWSLAGRDYLDHIDKKEMYQLIRQQKKLNFNPGEQFMYSNSCYFMLGLIIEKISGESLKEFARKNVFEPLGMSNTFFQDDNTKIIKNRAFSYLEENGEYKNQIMRYDLVGSGGVYSNIRDLYLWDQNFYHNKLGKGSNTLVEKMHREGTLNNGLVTGTGYAFGVQNGYYRGLKTVSHGGALAGYRSYLLRFPEQNVSIVILGNLNSIPIGKLPYDVADIILEKKLSPLSIQEKNLSSQNNTVNEQKVFEIEDFNQYTGVFFSEELNTNYRIISNDKQLCCSINSNPLMILKPISYDTFTMDDWEEIKFERNSKNMITGFRVSDGRITNLSFKKK
jgi:CubicO group peptidase (beta-lactamase class C family)